MLIIRYSSAYKKSYKRLSRSGKFPRKEVDEVIKFIQRGEKLDSIYRDHRLSGDMANNRECHIRSDLLLIYRIEENKLVLVLVNLGSHTDLFE